MSVTIVPSYPAQNWTALQQLLEVLSGTAGGFQIDIVDGIFATPASWPFVDSETPDFKELKTYTQMYEIEIDCMVMSPERFLDMFVAVGIQRVVIHYGSTEKWTEIIAHAAKHDYVVSLAVTNDVPYEDFSPLLTDVSDVQVMGVASVGQQGQPFDERTIATISRLKSDYPEIDIAVDGSVNLKTITKLCNAGATRLAPGSAISQAADPIAAYKQLCSATEIQQSIL